MPLRLRVATSLPFVADRACAPCLARLTRCHARRLFGASPTATGAAIPVSTSRLRQDYFSASDLWRSSAARRGALFSKKTEVLSSPETASASQALRQDWASVRENGQSTEGGTTLPHRKRRRRKSQEEGFSMPPDASSQLSAMSAESPRNSFRQRFFTYLSLSKPRLTFLMVLTATTAYSLFPVAVSPFSTSMNLSPLTLLNLTVGTALSSACANSLNMLLEPAHDAKMSRTRTRPLVRGLITPRAALVFAVVTGTAGVGLLHFGVNPTVAFLSGLNIFLYAGVYTPMKRISVANTWVGAIVGGIPPLMGWAAAAGQALPLAQAGWQDLLLDPKTSAGGWLLAALLFAWQFPHFNAIAYNIRHEYAAAGYKMMSSVNVPKTARIALRYSLAMFPICAALCWADVTGWAFFATSGVANGWMVRESFRFWRYSGAKNSARGLFWASVWHLPLVLVLAMVHKKGLWERFVQGGLDQEELVSYANPQVAEQDSKLTGNDNLIAA